MPSELRAPLLVRLAFRVLVPAELRDGMLGDLDQRFAEVAVAQGGPAARRWAWHQLGALRPLALRRAVGDRDNGQ